MLNYSELTKLYHTDPDPGVYLLIDMEKKIATENKRYQDGVVKALKETKEKASKVDDIINHAFAIATDSSVARPYNALSDSIDSIMNSYNVRSLDIVDATAEIEKAIKFISGRKRVSLAVNKPEDYVRHLNSLKEVISKSRAIGDEKTYEACVCAHTIARLAVNNIIYNINTFDYRNDSSKRDSFYQLIGEIDSLAHELYINSKNGLGYLEEDDDVGDYYALVNEIMYASVLIDIFTATYFYYNEYTVEGELFRIGRENLTPEMQRSIKQNNDLLFDRFMDIFDVIDRFADENVFATLNRELTAIDRKYNGNLAMDTRNVLSLWKYAQSDIKEHAEDMYRVIFECVRDTHPNFGIYLAAKTTYLTNQYRFSNGLIKHFDDRILLNLYELAVNDSINDNVKFCEALNEDDFKKRLRASRNKFGLDVNAIIKEYQPAIDRILEEDRSKRETSGGSTSGNGGSGSGNGRSGSGNGGGSTPPTPVPNPKKFDLNAFMMSILTHFPVIQSTVFTTALLGCMYRGAVFGLNNCFLTYALTTVLLTLITLVYRKTKLKDKAARKAHFASQAAVALVTVFASPYLIEFLEMIKVVDQFERNYTGAFGLSAMVLIAVFFVSNKE